MCNNTCVKLKQNIVQWITICGLEIPTCKLIHVSHLPRRVSLRGHLRDKLGGYHARYIILSPGSPVVHLGFKLV